MSKIDQLAHMRRNYSRDGLLEQDCPDEPFSLFRQWLEQAVQTELPPYEANAMVLSTLGDEGQPHARVMLLKGLDARGFVFYTNYQSDKGLQLAAHERGCMTFFWPVLERQVRIEGRIGPVSADESDAYYVQRPLGSRLGAWASPQSRVIENRDALNARLEAVQTRFASDDNPPRPAHWGGYRLLPERIEFWQGRTCRLHDRIDYRLGDTGWLRQRLAP